MATTSVIDVDVRAAAFEALKEQFDKFNAAVQSQPAAWAAVAKQSASVSAAIGGAQHASAGVAAGIGKVTSAQRLLNAQVTAGSKALSGWTHVSDKLAHNIASATRDIRSWASLGDPISKYLGSGGLKNILRTVATASVLSGLAGGGGLFGFDRLAGGVASRRYNAQGLGVTAGEQSALRVNYSSILDTDSALARFADAKSDIRKFGAFAALGIDADTVRTQDPADLLRMALPRAGERFRQTDGSQQQAAAYRLTDLFPMEELRRAAAAKPEEIEKMGAGYTRDLRDLRVSDPIQKAWQDLSLQLDRAASKIEAVFVTSLAPLAPGISKLSDAFAGSIKAFMSAPKLNEWMGDLGTGLEKISKYLVSDDFQEKIKKAGEEVGAFGQAVEKVAGGVDRWAVRFGLIAPPEGDKDWHFTGIPGVDRAMPNSAGSTVPWWLDTPGNAAKRAFGFKPSYSLDSPTQQNNEKQAWDFWKSKGLSDEAAAAELGNEAGESGFDPSVRGDGGKAGGIKQWHDDRRQALIRATGIDPWTANHADNLTASYVEQKNGIDAGAGRAWARLQGPVSIAGGVRTLVQDDERSGNQPEDIAKRTALAEQYYQRFHSVPANAPAPSTTEMETRRRLYEDNQRATGVAPFAGTFGAPVPRPRGLASPSAYLHSNYDDGDQSDLRKRISALPGIAAPAPELTQDNAPTNQAPARGGVYNLPGGRDARVTIVNSTGGNAAVQIGALAAAGYQP